MADHDETTTIGDAELRVTIRAGAEYQATPRLKDALDELAAALEEAEELDTAGFADLGLLGGFTLLYTSPVEVGYTEHDNTGKKKGNVEYGWKIEEGEK
jgi:hypothetical protein